MLLSALSAWAGAGALAQNQDDPKKQAEPAVVPVPPPAAPKPPKREPPGPEAEPEVVVLLKDGRQFTGLMVRSSPEQLVLRIGGVQVPLATEEVERYRVLPPVLERYRELRAAAGDDSELILRVAEWLQSRERYELALSEVRRVLEGDAANAEAKRLQTVLEEQIRLKVKAPKPPEPGPNPVSPARHMPERPTDFPLLTPAQINLIKVYEIDLDDQPRFIIPRASVERMLEASAGHPSVPATEEGREALLRRPAGEILALMFELRAREFYSDVEVLDTPRSIQMFRDSAARTWLNNSCATTQCHGGMDAGRLVLMNRRAAGDPALYTNLLILTRYQTAKGQALINWEAPDRSPLLQMGLPRAQAIIQHPEVPSGVAETDAWKPAFRSKSDPMFRAAVEWIKRMQKPRVDWPVEYKPVRPLEPEARPAGGSKKPPPPAERPSAEPKPR